MHAKATGQTSAKSTAKVATGPNVPILQSMSADRTASRLGLSTSEAARHLGVSLSTIRRWADSGHLRGYRTPGGQRRFTIEQLDQFLESLDGTASPRR
jgi:excisionase family DNA binding protein